LYGLISENPRDQQEIFFCSDLINLCKRIESYYCATEYFVNIICDTAMSNFVWSINNL
jgi:hypothetical protein